MTTTAAIARSVLEVYRGGATRYIDGYAESMPGDIAWTVRGAACMVCDDHEAREAFMGDFLTSFARLSGWRHDEVEGRMLGFRAVELALEVLAASTVHLESQ